MQSFIARWGVDAVPEIVDVAAKNAEQADLKEDYKNILAIALTIAVAAPDIISIWEWQIWRPIRPETFYVTIS